MKLPASKRSPKMISQNYFKIKSENRYITENDIELIIKIYLSYCAKVALNNKGT